MPSLLKNLRPIVAVAGLIAAGLPTGQQVDAVGGVAALRVRGKGMKKDMKKDVDDLCGELDDKCKLTTKVSPASRKIKKEISKQKKEKMKKDVEDLCGDMENCNMWALADDEEKIEPVNGRKQTTYTNGDVETSDHEWGIKHGKAEKQHRTGPPLTALDRFVYENGKERFSYENGKKQGKAEIVWPVGEANGELKEEVDELVETFFYVDGVKHGKHTREMNGKNNNFKIVMNWEDVHGKIDGLLTMLITHQDGEKVSTTATMANGEIDGLLEVVRTRPDGQQEAVSATVKMVDGELQTEILK